MNKILKHIGWKMLILFILSTISIKIEAQSNALIGRDFYFATWKNLNNTGDKIKLVIFAYGNGTVTIAGTNYPVTAGGQLTQEVPASSYFTQSLHITSTVDIVAYAGVLGDPINYYSADATALLPVQNLGTEYRLFQCPYGTGPSGNLNCVYRAIATQANTHIYQNGVLVSTLTAIGDVFVSDNGIDLTGARITSDKPIALISGSTDCNYLSTADDLLIEQMWPISTFGKEYIMVRLGSTQNNCRLVSDENTPLDVTVKIGTNAAQTYTIPVNGFVEFQFNDITQVTANKPFAVAQFTTGEDNPSMMWVNPIDQRVQHAQLAKLTDNSRFGSDVARYWTTWVTILTREQDFPYTVFKVNGVDKTYSTTISSTGIPGWKAGRYKMEEAEILVDASNANGLVAMIEGYSHDKSYIYAAAGGALNLQCYYTISTKTTPVNDTHYSATSALTHTFEAGDNISIKRTIDGLFTSVKWLLNNVAYTVSENTNATNSWALPASSLNVGLNTVTMSVRFTGATADSVYTGNVWYSAPYTPQMQSQSYTACPSAVVNLAIAAGSQSGYTFKWYSAASGGSLLGSGTSYNLTKDNNPVQSVWVEATTTGGYVYDRVRVDVTLSENCGNTDPTGCAVTGSLLFQETFDKYGDGLNPSSPIYSTEALPAGVTNYTFYGPVYHYFNVPWDGQYSLAKISNPSDGWGWHINDDYTSPNDSTIGRFMLVNADVQPKVFYTYRINNLLPGAPLNFYVMIANCSDGSNNNIKPNLKFELTDDDNNIIATYYTGNIPYCLKKSDWRQWGFPFNVPQGVSALTLKIYSNAPGGGGNDLGLDNLEVRFCIPPVTLSGKADYCPGENINLTGSYTDDGTFGSNWQMRWLYSSTGDLTSFSSWSVVASGLTLNRPMGAGYYRAVVGDQEKLDNLYYNSCAMSDMIKAGVVPSTLYWKTNAPDNNWNEPSNWADASNVVLNAVPRTCTDVHIPGNASAYPSLDTGSTIRTTLYGEPECRDIYFHFGGEVAKPHLLSSYNKAYVEYNFGYFSGSTYKTDGDSHSSTPMKRGQWYALATPLNKITPGDFSFGGKPDAWQQAFIRNNAGGSFSGQWEDPHNANATDISATQYSGIAVWMANIENGVVGSDVSYQTNLNNLQGLIWMPYFEDATTSNLHRIHQYTGTESRFYYYWNLDPNQTISSQYDAIQRGGEAYRFIFEGKTPSVYINSAANYYPTYRMTVPAGKELMIGNPFLSTLDFDKFYQINQSNLLNPTYRLYVNNTWGQQYTVGSGGALTQYIAPLQSFFIQTTGTGTVDLLFPPDLVSTTRPANKLKAEGQEQAYENVLYMEASNSEGSSSVTIGIKEGITVDQLFNDDEMYQQVPQIYIADTNRKNAVQFLPGDQEKEIKIGIKSTSEENIILRVDNVDRVNVESLILKDMLSGETYDLLRGASQLTFKNTPNVTDRFVLKIGKQTSDTKEIKKEEGVNVSVEGKKLLVKATEIINQVTVTNIQGVNILNSPFVNTQNFSTELKAPTGIYIVNVTLTTGEIKKEKIVVK